MSYGLQPKYISKKGIIVLRRSLFVHDHGRLYCVRADREQFSEISLVTDSGFLTRDGPTVGHAEHRLWMVSLWRWHFGTVCYELCGYSVSTTGNRAQVAVGTVPLERFAGRTGAGARVPPLGRWFIWVFANDHNWFIFSPQPERW